MRMFSEFTLFKRSTEKVWQMNRSAKGLLVVSTNVDGLVWSISATHQICQTFSMNSIKIIMLNLIVLTLP